MGSISPARGPVRRATRLDLELEDDVDDDQAHWPEEVRPLIITAAPHGRTWLAGGDIGQVRMIDAVAVRRGRSS